MPFNADNIVIHYFSGTGNTFRASSWMAGRAAKNGIRASLIPVTAGAEKIREGYGPGTLLGVAGPVHGFTAPWAVIRFAMGLPRAMGASAFVVFTRGATAPGILVPGFAGSACLVVALVLLLKGYKLRGVTGLDMPSNWMSLHWGLAPVNAARIKAKTMPAAERFIQKLIEGKTHFLTAYNLFELAGGIVLLPVSAIYLLMGRFGLAKLFYADQRCTGCGMCALNCPTGSLTMEGKKNPRPYWAFSCESCMRCMGWCPRQAVQASHPLAYVFYRLMQGAAFIFFAGWLLSLFGLALPKNPFIRYPLYYFYCIGMFWAVYRLVTVALRYAPINAAFTAVTLTRYYRRYHESETRPGDMARSKIFPGDDQIHNGG